MQLQFTLAERQLLADILEETRYALMQGASAEREVPERDRIKARECIDLFGKVVERHLEFSADELDMLAAVLSDRDRELRERGVSQEQRRLLQSVLDKITEACMMI